MAIATETVATNVPLPLPPPTAAVIRSVEVQLRFRVATPIEPLWPNDVDLPHMEQAARVAAGIASEEEQIAWVLVLSARECQPTDTPSCHVHVQLRCRQSGRDQRRISAHASSRGSAGSKLARARGLRPQGDKVEGGTLMTAANPFAALDD